MLDGEVPEVPEDHPIKEILAGIDDGLNTRDREILWNDWTRFSNLLMFKDWCMRQPDPRAAGRRMISLWRSRLDPNNQADEILKSFGGMEAAPETLGRLQDLVGDVCSTLYGVVNME